jgi:hypothetical protein
MDTMDTFQEPIRIRTEIPRSEVIDFIASLGMKCEDVRNHVSSVVIEPGYITITQYEHDDTGHHMETKDGDLVVVNTMILIRKD